jgi:tellurite resistance protein TerC
MGHPPLLQGQVVRLSMVEGAPLSYWIGFHLILLTLIVVDLAVLGRGKASTQTKQNVVFVLFLLALAGAFGFWIGQEQGHQLALEFASGYLIELSLSIDNLFVFLLLFRSFGLSAEAQRKALLLGILGAIVMRGVFIFTGIALLRRFAWIQYFFGALLVVAAVRLLMPKHEGATSRAKWITAWTKRFGDSPKATFVLAVISIELVDVVFALDSVPAVLAISNHPFVVYTSNIFAILGLRSLYFLLAGLLDRLRFLHLGLAAILGFVGGKMLTSKWIHVPVAVSLGFIVLVVAVATVTSLRSTSKA